MPRADISKKEVGKVRSSNGEGLDKAVVIKAVLAVLGIGAGIFLVVRSLSEKPNQFVNTPAQESAAEVQAGAASNPDKPKIEVQIRKNPDVPKSIGNAGGAKYLPDVPAR